MELLLWAGGKDTATMGETQWCEELLNQPSLLEHRTGPTGAQGLSTTTVRVDAKRSWRAVGGANTAGVQEALGTLFQVLLWLTLQIQLLR